MKMKDSSNYKFDQPMEKGTIPVTKEEWNTSYLDFNEDSISMTSNTSTVPSSFVRHRIQEHELMKLEMIRDQIDPEYNHNNVVINVVLSADNSQVNSSSFTDVVNDIIAQTNIPKKIKNAPKKSQWNMHTIYTNIRRPKYIICLIVLIFAFIGSTIGLHSILSENKAQSTDTTTSVKQSSSTTTIVDKTTTTSASTVLTETNSTPTDATQLVTTTKTSTTEENPFDPNLIIITRAEWGAKPMTGARKQSMPIERVIFMQTYTEESCITEEKCKKFIQDRQMSAYPEAQDIKENFLISSNGIVYEGRGFSKEGQHTQDKGGTSYNKKTIGFSFIGNYTDIEPNEKMFNKTLNFLESSVAKGNLSSDYIIYHQQQLIGGTLEESLFNFTTKFDHWKSSPTIVRRNEWGALLRSGENVVRFIVPHVLISSTGGPSCDTKSDCIEIVKKIQIEEKPLFQDIAYNFIFGGNDLIFEGRSFDIMGNHTKYENYDSLGILFIGNYSESPPKSSLISKLLNEFLPYAVNLSKLENDYKIFARRQCVVNITSPGDSFFELMKQWPHFDADKSPNICEIGCTTG